MKLLIVSADPTHDLAPAQALAEQCRAAGLAVLAVVPCHMLVREVVRLAPQAVVVLAPLPDAELSAALALLAASAPRPVLMLGAEAVPELPAETLAAWLQAGVMAWLPGPGDAARLRAALALALPRHAQEMDLRRQLADALARLDERKWIDRAKGVLMQHQQLSEDDAFALLRAASMQANLRVGEVSRGVIEAAQAADAVNRAGQLRMLSQRHVKALALRIGGAVRSRADDGLPETVQRLQANLDRLAAMPLGATVLPLLAATQDAWRALQRTGDHLPWAPRPAQANAAPAAAALATLAEADQRAEALLAQADALTAALEEASGRRHLRVINLCGRQRMLSQRLAKQALLAGLLPQAQAAEHAGAAARTIQEFEAAMALLEQMPLATDTLRAALAQARGQWQRLLQGLRRSAGDEAQAGRATLARESEALLNSFEQLTSLYEHSMQVLLG